MRRMRKKLSIMLMFTSNDFFSTVAAVIVAIDTYHIILKIIFVTLSQSALTDELCGETLKLSLISPLICILALTSSNAN